MVNETPSTSEKPTNEKFEIQHYIALWQHYEDRGGSDKDRMVTVVTWLLAFAAVILGFIATKYDFSAQSFKEKELAA